jgi:hypothetical protein
LFAFYGRNILIPHAVEYQEKNEKESLVVNKNKNE